MHKWGIFESKWWGKTLVEFNPTSDDAWDHPSGEHFTCNINEINSNIDDVVDFLLSKEGRYCWGIYLPEEIVNKIDEKIDRTDKWLVGQLDFMKRQLNYGR